MNLEGDAEPAPEPDPEVGFKVAVGLVPFMAMLLTIKDGQGLVSVGLGMLRVMDLSGMPVGHDVPHGASTVVVVWKVSNRDHSDEPDNVLT